MLVTRLDEKEDIQVIKTYLVDAEVPFLCSKRTLEMWNFKINGKEKILEIESKTDRSQKKLKRSDTVGVHYGIILETKKKQDLSILFLEEEEGDLCSFKAVRQVHALN